MKCSFVLAWRGPCGSDLPCRDHADVLCDSCGQPATHECEETFGFVCGVPLCDECEHKISPDGTNGGTFDHCRKDAQKHLPWYAR